MEESYSYYEEKHRNDYNLGDWLALREKEVNESEQRQIGALKVILCSIS